MKKYILILLLASCATKNNIQEVQQPPARPIISAKKEAIKIDKKVKFTDIVYFAFDSSSINESMADELTDNVIWLKQNPAQNLTIEGHCDERGTKEYNLALGERRAYAVKKFLVNSGVKKNRLKTVSYGEERPNALGSSERAHQKNRRVQFIKN